MKNHMDDIMTMVKSKDENIIGRKYFIFCLGGSNSEIFNYANLMWNKYTNDSTFRFC